MFPDFKALSLCAARYVCISSSYCCIYVATRRARAREWPAAGQGRGVRGAAGGARARGCRRQHAAGTTTTILYVCPRTTREVAAVSTLQAPPLPLSEHARIYVLTSARYSHSYSNRASLLPASNTALTENQAGEILHFNSRPRAAQARPPYTSSSRPHTLVA